MLKRTTVKKHKLFTKITQFNMAKKKNNKKNKQVYQKVLRRDIDKYIRKIM